MSKASADKSSAKGKEVLPMNSEMRQSISIPEDEADFIQILIPPTDLNKKDLTNQVLVGKIITAKALSKQGIRNACTKIWEPYTNVYVSEISNNIYSFTFEEESEVEEALENSHFFILNNLLSVQRWGSAKTCYEVSFEKVPFWIQIHDLPLASFSLESITAIIKRVGEVLEIENPIAMGKVIRPFARARVIIDISKPLWAGSWISVGNNNKMWVVFKYERLQGLCFNCGVLGHDQKTCKNPKIMASFNKVKPKFGPFLSATTPKPLAALINELEVFQFKNSIKKEIKLSSESPFVVSSTPTDLDVNIQEEQGSTSPSKEINAEDERNEEVEGVEIGSPMENIMCRKEELGVLGKGPIMGTISKPKEKLEIIDLTTDVEGGVMDTYLFVPSPFGPELLNQAVVPHAGPKFWNSNLQQQNEAGLIVCRQDPIKFTYSESEIGSSSKRLTSKPLAITEHDYFIELPEEGEDRIGDKKTQRLDLASESELIQTWNHRLNLKRSRVPGISLDDVEEELVKRKKMKKESWFDAEGKLVCVTVSTVLGTQTFVVDEDGGLRPNTP